MNEELMQKMRIFLAEYYGVDITEAVCKFSTQNYAFIFPDKPYMIRVSMTPKKERGEVLSELMWVDDLKQFKQTICEPSTSLRDRIIEEFVIDGTTYRASMFRKARGNVQTVPEMSPMFFICVGELLGSIHNVSEDEQKIGMRFQRSNLKEDFEVRKGRVWDMMTAEEQEKIIKVMDKIDALPKNTGNYGLCHGDFHTLNFFVEANNIWLFDFDSCLYAHYLYDIASLVTDCLQMGYKRGKDCRKILNEDILPYLKAGYCLNKECSEDYWDALELFIQYRLAVIVMSLRLIKNDNLHDSQKFYESILTADDCLGAMTAALNDDRK